MDPGTIGAVLLAIVSGAAGEAGSRLWDGLTALVRRPFRHRASEGAVAVSSGDEELAALQQTPGDERRALALARALVARADADEDFQHELEIWWAQADPIRVTGGNVSKTITGGSQHGPVLQGRDFSNVSISAAPAVPPTVPSS